MEGKRQEKEVLQPVTHSRASYFGLLALLQLLGLFFLVLVDDLQPCRWFHASALASWQIIAPVLLLLDAVPVFYRFFELRQVVTVGCMVSVLVYDTGLLLWLGTAYLRDESHTSVSRCRADNGQYDFTDVQSTADLFLAGVLLSQIIIQAVGLLLMLKRLRCDPGISWCPRFSRDLLACLVLPYAALLVGLQIAESLVPNGYYATGAQTSWHLFVLLLPFTELGTAEVLNRGLALRDFGHFVAWLAAAAQTLLVAMWMATQVGRRELGTRSCAYGRQLYDRERASVIAQVVMLFGLGLLAASMCALAARQFLRTTKRLERCH
jgi:hypothetical protein